MKKPRGNLLCRDHFCESWKMYGPGRGWEFSTPNNANDSLWGEGWSFSIGEPKPQGHFAKRLQNIGVGGLQQNNINQNALY